MNSNEALQEAYWFPVRSMATRGLLRVGEVGSSITILCTNPKGARGMVGATRTGELQVELGWMLEGGSPVRQTLHLRRRTTPKGTALDVVCPRSDEVCRDLYLKGEMFASGKGHGFSRSALSATRATREWQSALMRLEGSDGRRRRDGSRWDFDVKTKGDPRKHLSAPDRARHDDWTRHKAEEESRRIDKYFEGLGTLAGMQCAKRGITEIYRLEFDQGVDAARCEAVNLSRADQPGDLLKVGPYPQGVTSDHEHIDIRDLLTSNLLIPNAKTSGSLMWRANGGVDAAFLFTIDLTLPAAVMFIEMRLRAGGSSLQAIRILPPDRRGRRLFECPATGKPAEILYRREQLFLSRKAACLLHPRKQEE